MKGGMYMLHMVTLDGKKVALEISKRNYTIVGFSKICKVHRQTIAEIINRGMKCKLLNACKIAQGLDLEVEDLLLKEG